MGIFGLMIPEEYGGLGESLLTYALCVEEIARGWMSVSGIINTHFIVAYMLAPARHRGAEAEVPAPDGDRRGPRRVLDERAGAGLGRRRDLDQGGAPRRERRLGGHRAEDVADQRRVGQPRRRARQDRRRRRVGLPQHDDVPRREGDRLRRDRSGADRPGQDRQDGLQGRRHHRAHPRRVPHDDRADPRGGAGQGLLPDDGRRRGRPGQRRRARLRCGAAGLRARHRLRPAAGDVRQEDRRAPGHPVPDRRHGRPRSRPPTR